LQNLLVAAPVFVKTENCTLKHFFSKGKTTDPQIQNLQINLQILFFVLSAHTNCEVLSVHDYFHLKYGDL